MKGLDLYLQCQMVEYVESKNWLDLRTHGEIYRSDGFIAVKHNSTSSYTTTVVDKIIEVYLPAKCFQLNPEKLHPVIRGDTRDVNCPC